MYSKESYDSPVTEVIPAIEACPVLSGSDYSSGGMEDPFIDDDWTI